ncbi:MAG: hypothetical protein AAFP77_31405, partial [Bacteroidota bacterium]
MILRYFPRTWMIWLSCFFYTSAFTQSADSLAHILADRAEEFNNEKSLPFLDEAFELCAQKKCADSTMARLYQRKSVATYLAQIDNDLSLVYTDSAIFFYEKAFGAGRLITANSYFNKGVILSALGQNLTAKPFFEAAIQKLGSNTESPQLVLDSIELRWKFQLLKINRRLGEISSALQIGEEILRSRSLYKQVETGVVLVTGLIYLDRGQYDRAKDMYLAHLDKYSTNPSFTATSNLGLSYLKLGDLQPAEKNLLLRHRRDLERYSQNVNNNSRIPLSNSHANLLQLSLLKEDWQQAEYHYSEALRLLLEVDSTGRRPRFAEIYFKKSKLEHALGHYESSLAFLTKAMNVV